MDAASHKWGFWWQIHRHQNKDLLYGLQGNDGLLLTGDQCDARDMAGYGGVHSLVITDAKILSFNDLVGKQFKRGAIYTNAQAIYQMIFHARLLLVAIAELNQISLEQKYLPLGRQRNDFDSSASKGPLKRKFDQFSNVAPVHAGNDAITRGLNCRYAKRP